MAADIKTFSDGIKDLVNGLANSRNKSVTNVITSNRVSDASLNAIYKNGLGNKIVNLKINTAFKEGVTIDGETNHNKQTKRIIKEIREASRWMLTFGRGVIAIIEDGKKTDEPLSAIPNINRTSVRAFDGSMVTAMSVIVDVTDPNYMKPEAYVIRGATFHPSRIIDFSYVKPREQDLPTYQYGGISLFELIYTQIINDGIVERSSAAIIEKNATMFYKIEGFKSLLADGKHKEMVEFFSQLENLRSIYGAGLLDKEDDIEVVSQTLTNLSEVDTIALRRVALVSDIPVSILVGESVKGLNGTGDNEMETFYIGIENLQENYILDPMNEVFQKLGLGEDVEFNHPEQMTPIQRAEYEALVLENAAKMEALGYDSSDYLKENGIEPAEDEFDSEFGEELDDLDRELMEEETLDDLDLELMEEDELDL